MNIKRKRNSIITMTPPIAAPSAIRHRSPPAWPHPRSPGDIILSLHQFLVNPDSTPGQAKGVRRRLLEALGEATLRGRPTRVVAPVAMASTPEAWGIRPGRDVARRTPVRRLQVATEPPLSPHRPQIRHHSSRVSRDTSTRAETAQKPINTFTLLQSCQ